MSEVPNAQIVGLVRFSVLATDYYTERFGTVDKIAEHIFSTERLALRFKLFEALCLPSLVRQSDQGFTCIILTSTLLPTEAMARLQELVSPHSNIHLHPAEPGNHYPVIRAAYNSISTEGFSHRIAFRIDDDDAVDGDFITRLRRLGQGLLALHDKDVPTVIAFNRGFYVEKTKKGEVVIADTCERAPLSVGTALLAPVSYSRNPYRYNHRFLPQHYNTYTDISVPGFIRTIHPDNKSVPSKQGLTHRMQDDKIARQIKQHFGHDIEMLRQLL
jgi:hypothetical protein